MNEIEKSENTDTNGTLWSRIAKHRRMVSMTALIVFFSFPVIYLIVKSSAAPPISEQSSSAPPTSQQSPQDTGVAAMEDIAIRQPSADNFLNLSLAYYQVNKYQECIAAAQKSLALKPGFASAYNNISMWDSAILYATEAIRIQPDFQVAKNNLAASLDHKKQSDFGIKQLEDSARMEPTSERLFNLSLAYYNSGRYEECIAEAKKALKMKPDYPEAWNNICSAYNMLGRFADGKAAAEQALRLKPDFEIARNNLNWSQRELDKKK